MVRLTQIDHSQSDRYIPYIPGAYSEYSKKNVSQCKYFSKVEDDDGWDHIFYYYDLK